MTARSFPNRSLMYASNFASNASGHLEHALKHLLRRGARLVRVEHVHDGALAEVALHQLPTSDAW
jgi:hypothetical protein